MAAFPIHQRHTVLTPQSVCKGLTRIEQDLGKVCPQIWASSNMCIVPHLPPAQTVDGIFRNICILKSQADIFKVSPVGEM